MIYSLRGILIYSDTNVIVVECAGVGYKCKTTRNTLSKLPSLGEELFVYTYMVVREDSVDLYGFADKSELECFKLITSVNGVGPRIGIAILSEFAPSKIALFIASGDSKSLTLASGVGAKLAGRIILELKDKVGEPSISFGDDVMIAVEAGKNNSMKEAIAALVSLGYSQSEASLAVGGMDPESSVDSLLKGALKNLARK